MEHFKFDVFLSHNSSDIRAVEQLATSLEDKFQIKVFLDRWHLIPGDPWQEDLENAIEASRTIAVFLGPSGMGTWHNEEMRAALDQCAGDRNRRVIPVLLPGARDPQNSKLPAFLSRRTWVDFRAGLEDPKALHSFIAGIKGTMPGRTDAPVGEPQGLVGKKAVSAGGLSADLYLRLRASLLESDVLESNRRLKSFFAHPELKPWQNKVPEADSSDERVDLLIDFLTGRKSGDGRLLLAIFVQALLDQTDPADAAYGSWKSLLEELG